MGRVLLIVQLFVAITAVSQTRTKVSFDNSDLSQVHQRMEFNLSAFLTELNVAFFEKRNPRFDGGMMTTKEGQARILSLWKTTSFRCADPELGGNILRLPSGGYQFRNIPLIIIINGKPASGEEAVVNLDFEGRIDDVNFGLDQHKYTALLSKGNDLTDFKRRQVIVDFLENFRTAYNRRDIDMLQKTFSDNALIIVGRVLEPKPDHPEIMMSLGKKRVELIQYNKQQYLANLSKSFAKNAFIDVRFDEIEITKHPGFVNIYGVNLKQSWKSSSYGDVGYLFLMIDFENEQQPLIHVRSWQPEKETVKEEVIELGDFDIIK